MTLKRTPTSTGNRLKGTWSFWIKRNTLNGTTSARYLFYSLNGTNADAVRFNDDDGGDSLRALFSDGSGSNNNCFINFDKLRDTSAWQHVLIVYDSTIDTFDEMRDLGLERLKIFINGRRMIETGGNTAQNIGVGTNRPMQVWGIEGFVNTLFATNTGGDDAAVTTFDTYFVDGQALTPDVFGFYKDGKGYISLGSSMATDFKPGQWVPKAPRVIKSEINRRGGFGVNGYYLPMNDSKNFGADFHTTPNSIIKLQEDLPQPKVSIASTAQAGLAYTDVLRADPYAANLVLALPFVSGGLGTDGTSSGISTGFGDYSHTIRNSGVAKTTELYGSVAIGNTGVYYGSSANFGGAGGDDYILVPASSDFVYGTNDWTIETWWYPTSVTRQAIYHGSFGADWSIGIDFNGTNTNYKLGFWASSNGSSWNLANADAGGNGICGVGVTTDQWYHIAYERHNNNLSMYLNGVSVGIVTDVTASIDVTSSDKQAIGVWYNTTAMNEISGYLQDFRIYNGVAKYKGGFDAPKPFTPVGIATWRAVPDTTANNFATFNAVDSGINGTGTLSDGNLTFTSNSNVAGRRATIGFPTTGEYYWETRISSATGGWPNVGILKNSQRIVGTYNTDGTTQVRPYGADSLRPYLIFDTTDVIAKVSDTALTGGDIIQCAWSSDGTDGKLWFGINDQWYGYNGSNVVTLTKAQVAAGNTAIRTVGVVTESWSPVMYVYRTEEHNINFGQNPTFSGNTTAGTFTDGNGKGLFKYEPPTDFLALCEDNLPTPAIADPGKHFKTVLYEGDGKEGRRIAGVGFTPDVVWVKTRSSTNNHYLVDSVRGLTGGGILPSNTSTENGRQTLITTLDSDGFTVGHTYNEVANGATNGDGAEVVAWCWKAGAGTTSTNTDGTLESVVSVNQDAGFSIVSWTSNGASSVVTTGHGLAKTPKFILVKNRDASDNWFVYHSDIQTTNRQYLQLNTNSTTITLPSNDLWSTFDTSTFGVRQASIASNGARIIAYCWAEIEGFSKFGSYIGDDRDDDGVFVYCGFKPAMVIIKNTTTSSLNWHIIDSSRSSTNPAVAKLYPNTTDIENATITDNGVDFLSNGFKLRGDVSFNNATNGNGDTMIFAAFAESPFKTANAK